MVTDGSVGDCRELSGGVACALPLHPRFSIVNTLLSQMKDENY
jgi:hypothetical protein